MYSDEWTINPKIQNCQIICINKTAEDAFVELIKRVFASPWQLMPDTVSVPLLENIMCLISFAILIFFLLELFDAKHHEETTNCNLIDLAQ